MKGPEIKSGSAIETTMKRLTKLWSNFAKYSDPNSKENTEILKVEWKPVMKDELNFINIDEELTVGVNPEAERMAFWDRLYENFSHAKHW